MICSLFTVSPPCTIHSQEIHASCDRILIFIVPISCRRRKRLQSSSLRSTPYLHSTHKLPLEEEIVVQDIRWPWPCTLEKKRKTCRTWEILVLCTLRWRFPGVRLWAPWTNKQKCSSFLNFLISSPNWANLVIYKLYVGDFYAI
jgi:hypothetical protein